MTVYVDDMYATHLGRYGRMKMSHMIADSDDELHAMAARIGVARRWHQASPPASTSHYDIALSKRARAIECGAVSIPMKVLAAMAARRRATGVLGRPDDALDWFGARRDRRSQAAVMASVVGGLAG